MLAGLALRLGIGWPRLGALGRRMVVRGILIGDAVVGGLKCLVMHFNVVSLCSHED